MRRLGILASGRGSNLLAIADRIDDGRLPGAEIALVLSNVADAPVIDSARARKLPVVVVESRGKPREAHDAAMLQVLIDHNVDLVCLAGYMRLLSRDFVDAYRNRILNIHPSLLPAFTGLDAQRQALDYGVKVAGCTVHFVDEELDHGAIVLQKAVNVSEEEDEHSLAARILEQEHQAYSEAIAKVISGEYEIQGRRFVRTT